MEKQRKKQYHPPACASLELEFRENQEQILFRQEYALNTKPNTIDLLIVKENDVALKSGLGAIFKKYNICEYKSPKDSLNERIYYRTMAYTYLLAAYDRKIQSLSEITVTFIRQSKPVKLLKKFSEWGFEIIDYEPGIFYVRKLGHVDIQIIVIGSLDKKYRWITKLTDKVELDDVKDLLSEIEKLQDERDYLNAEAVLDMMTKLNGNKKWIKEMYSMGAFKDLFKEDFEKKDREIAELSEQLQSKDEQLQSKDEQLQSKDEQLQNEKNENTELRKEIAQLKKQLTEQVNKIAML